MTARAVVGWVQISGCIAAFGDKLAPEDVQWLRHFASAHVLAAQHNYAAAIALFTELSTAVSGHPICDLQASCDDVDRRVA